MPIVQMIRAPLPNLDSYSESSLGMLCPDKCFTSCPLQMPVARVLSDLRAASLSGRSRPDKSRAAGLTMSTLDEGAGCGCGSEVRGEW